MATEIVTLKVIDSFTPEHFAKPFSYFRPPPAGLQSYRWGRTIKDPNTIIWILTWDSVRAHEDFIESSVYAAFVATIMAFSAAPVSLFHAHLHPFPHTKVYEAGILEIAIVSKKTDVSHDVFEAANAKILSLAQKASGYHSHFHGIQHEDPNIYVTLVGWDSVEAAEALNQPRAAAADLIVPGGLRVDHVKLQPE
ncbi:hypothetical protein JB92DRAFT_3111007 [Gautieria morchelliformis]|nr:hypothetical protein JB92DRAFT_3111007 [Gautieria morchelliformis]